MSCLISIPEETLLLIKREVEEGVHGAGGFCVVIIFKVTKFATKGKDKKTKLKTSFQDPKQIYKQDIFLGFLFGSGTDRKVSSFGLL